MQLSQQTNHTESRMEIESGIGKQLRRIVCGIAFSVACLTQAHAGSPVDNHVKAALYDIERAEKQAKGLSIAKTAAVKRVQRSLANARAQLQASKNQTHDSWGAASQRLTGLEQRISALTNAAASKEPAPSASSTIARPVQPSRQSATNRVDAYQQDLLATINRQVDALAQRVSNLDALAFSEARIVTQWRAEASRMQALQAKLQSPQHPQVLEVRQKVHGLQTLIEQRVSAAVESEALLGDTVAATQAIEVRSRVLMPPTPDSPFTDESIKLFAKRLKALSETSRSDHRYLLSIKGKTRAVVESRIDSLLAATGDHRQAQIERHALQFVKKLVAGLSTADFFAGQPAQTKVQHIDRNLTTLREAIGLLQVIEYFEQQTGLDVLDTAQKENGYKTAITQLVARDHEILGQRRFPPVRSTDSVLLAAASEVLGRKDYRVNPIRRMAVTYDRQRKSTAEGDIDWGSVVTTVTVTGYEWDEFGVTTAELVDGEIYLYYNLLKFFHQGGTDVPTGKWTLAERHRSGRILEQNIGE